MVTQGTAAKLLTERAKELLVGAAALATEAEAMRNNAMKLERQITEMKTRAGEYESAAKKLGA